MFAFFRLQTTARKQVKTVLFSVVESTMGCFALQDTDLQVLDLSHNKLTSAACHMLSTALAKPQNVRGWGMSGASTLGSRKEVPGTPRRPAQTPAKGFHSCLQELNLSWNAIGKNNT